MVTLRSLFVAGYSRARSAATRCRSLSADSSVTPGFRRPIMRMKRFRRESMPGSSVQTVQRLAAGVML